MDFAILLISNLLFLLTACFLFMRLLKNDERRRELEIKKANSKEIVMLRLRAYERLALFLDRIDPNAMVLRFLEPDMSALELQLKLLDQIRQEYGHNVAQQIYVSKELWAQIVLVKENTIKLINTAAAQGNLAEPANKFAEHIVQASLTTAEAYSPIASDMLKDEVSSLF